RSPAHLVCFTPPCRHSFWQTRTPSGEIPPPPWQAARLSSVAPCTLPLRLAAFSLLPCVPASRPPCPRPPASHVQLVLPSCPGGAALGRIAFPPALLDDVAAERRLAQVPELRRNAGLAIVSNRRDFPQR